MIGLTHGDGISPEQLSLIFSTEFKEEWGKSTYREINIGHLHQKRERSFQGVTPLNGLTVRVHPALTNVDAYHHSHGLIGEPIKAVEAWRYDRTMVRGSHMVRARDDIREACT